MIQMWSLRSTAIPETCPSIQLPGNGFGQYGSGWNFGTPGALEGCPIGGGSGSAKAGLARPAMTAASRSTLNDPIMIIPPRQNGLFLLVDHTQARAYASPLTSAKVPTGDIAAMVIT
jgi:hypothetical protein